MASPAQPLDDQLFEPVPDQSPMIKALILGMIAHTRHGIVSVTSGRESSSDGS